MGGSPSQTTTSTPTMDPAIKARLLGNMGTGDAITSGILPKWDPSAGSPVQYTPSFDESGMPNYSGTGMTGGYVNADGTPWQAPTTFTADFSPDQLKAFENIRGMSGLTSSQLGGDVYKDLSTFNAPTVSSTNVNAGTVTPASVRDVNPMQAASVAPVASTGAKTFADYDLSKFSNPYMASVVDPVKQFFQQEGDRAASAAVSQGRAAGALRGSSPALAATLAREGVARQAGMALSPLYADAFKTSAGLVEGAAERDLRSQMSNQQTATTVGTTNAQLAQDAAGKNFGYQGQRALTDASNQQQAGIVNGQLGLQGQMANQDAGLRAGIANQQGAVSSAGVRAGGAAGIADSNRGAFDSSNIINQLLLGIGGQQQGLNQSKLDDIIKALNIRNSLVTGAVPGSTGTTSTQTGGGSGIAGMLGGLGSLAGGLGALGLTI